MKLCDVKSDNNKVTKTSELQTRYLQNRRPLLASRAYEKLQNIRT